jgi:antitoxin HicB
MLFPVTLEPDDNGTILVVCDLLPELTTFGDDREDALLRAADAVSEALAARLASWTLTPLPRSASIESGDVVRVPLLVVAKLVLMNACISGGVNRAELSRRLGWHREQVDRLFRADHATRMDQIEAALAVLGKDVDLVLIDAA